MESVSGMTAARAQSDGMEPNATSSAPAEFTQNAAPAIDRLLLVSDQLSGTAELLSDRMRDCRPAAEPTDRDKSVW